MSLRFKTHPACPAYVTGQGLIFFIRSPERLPAAA